MDLQDLLSRIHERIIDKYGNDVVVGLRVDSGTIDFDWHANATPAQKSVIQNNVNTLIDRVRDEQQGSEVLRTQLVGTLRRRLAQVQNNADLATLYDDVRQVAHTEAVLDRTIQAQMRILQLTHPDLVSIDLTTVRGKAIYLQAATVAVSL